MPDSRESLGRDSIKGGFVLLSSSEMKGAGLLI